MPSWGDVNGLFSHPIPLTHGWFPIIVQLIAAIVLVCAIGWRTPRWRFVWLPVAALFGVALTALTHWYINVEGLSGSPAPQSLWIWIGVTGLALVVLVLGWRGVGWWRRSASVLAVLLCLMSAGLTLNFWVGYFSTVQTAWHDVTRGRLPDQVDMATLLRMRHTGVAPPNGIVASVTIPDTVSHFRHRDELIYLPPAWLASNPPPRLPVVMMIGAEFQNPADWIRLGNAVSTADEFADSHGGNAPVLVFVDSTGSFNNDTECVNGTRGNVADHLAKEVVPYVNSTFDTSDKATDWGIVGFSVGGTCAVDLTAMHPDKFSAFVDIAGDLAPNAGNRQETINRLFGGNADAYADFDPTTVITRHGRYVGVSAWFPCPAGETAPADTLCELGRANGIECSVAVLPGRHDWPFAATAFAEALPWLAGQLGSPGAPRLPLPRT